MSEAKFKVTVSQALHEGGTKFYRTVEVRSLATGASLFAIFQWGSASRDWEDVNDRGGSSMFVLADIAGSLLRKLREKRAGGYTIWQNTNLELDGNQMGDYVEGFRPKNADDRDTVKALIRVEAKREITARSPVIGHGRKTKPPAPPAPVRDESENIEGWGAW